METRSTRKRHSTTPNLSHAKRYLGLEFGEIQPSPKKRKIETSPLENEAIAPKSFYGKREKKSFPHSPGRRKAVYKVLDKISDENTDSDGEYIRGKQMSACKMSRFDFHSSTSDSADTDGELSIKRPLRESNSLRKSNSKKKPLKIIKTTKTPKGKQKEQVSSKSTGNITIQRRRETSKDNPDTPIIPGKKFFKTRSPGSSTVTTGSVIGRKFDLKFVTKKHQGSKTQGSKENVKKSYSTKKVNKACFTKAIEFKTEKQFMSDGEISGGDPNKNCQTANEKSETVDQSESIYIATPVNLTDVLKDSAIDTANSSDMCSNDQAGEDCTTEIFQDVESETVSLISGSEDLFSDVMDSGRNTPIDSGRNTPIDSGRNTPIDSGRNTPSCVSPLSSKPASPSSSVDTERPSSTVSGPVTVSQEKKLFPIFTKQVSSSPSSQTSKLRSSRSSSPAISPLLRSTKNKDKMEQMVIDAGQKKFGVTQCEACGMVYNIADPDDETMHFNHHQNTLAALKFPGWKKENVVQKYPFDGSRVLKVTYDSPKYALKKIEEINFIMSQELGTTDHGFHFRPSYQAFLYISDNKRVEGCVIAEPLDQGYPVMPDSDSSQSSQNHPGNRPWYCSDTPEPASVGISRIWVHNQCRRKGVATKLLDCVRQWFAYGSVIPKRKIAFSDPTQNGKTLAMKYTGSAKFLVYKFNK